MSLPSFQIDFLDHVAIRVRDIESSAHWYERVLGLQPYTSEHWGSFPVLMRAGMIGVAIFPSRTEMPKALEKEDYLKIDHFAFRVNAANFAKAKDRFERLNIPFEEQNHHHYQSLYLRDPDGHQVELTTLLISLDT